MEKAICAAPNCESGVRSKGFCNAHHLRLLRYGSLDGAPKRSMRDRFESKILREEDGCWEWTGGHFKGTGYAIFNIPSPADGRWRPATAHRISYELYIGPIPNGLVIDHLCRNRGCVNPEHLEPVAQRINMLRGMAPSAVAVRENRCGRGHEFTPENTITRTRNGKAKRDCRECVRATDRVRNKTDSRREHYRAAYRRRKAASAGGG